MRTPGQPGYGLPPREGIVDLTRDIADLKAAVAALQAMQANSLQFNTVYQQVNGLTFPGDSNFYSYCLTSTYEPPPWAGRLTFFLNVSAGTTFNTSGILAVQTGGANNGGAQAEVGVSRALNGTGATSVDATYAGSNTFAPGSYAHVIFSVFVAATAASNTGSGNANINGILLWSRA